MPSCRQCRTAGIGATSTKALAAGIPVAEYRTALPPTTPHSAGSSALGLTAAVNSTVASGINGQQVADRPILRCSLLPNPANKGGVAQQSEVILSAFPDRARSTTCCSGAHRRLRTVPWQSPAFHPSRRSYRLNGPSVDLGRTSRLNFARLDTSLTASHQPAGSRCSTIADGS